MSHVPQSKTTTSPPVQTQTQIQRIGNAIAKSSPQGQLSELLEQPDLPDPSTAVSDTPTRLSRPTSADSDLPLRRFDNNAFHRVQPTYGTIKSHIDPTATFRPAKDPQDPTGDLTTPALHVHGKPEDKARSPFTSFSSYDSTSPAGSLYGKHLITTSKNRLEGLATEPKPTVLTQAAIQQDILRSKDPRFDEEARNVTQQGQPPWQPDEEQTAFVHQIGQPGSHLDPSLRPAIKKLEWRESFRVANAARPPQGSSAGTALRRLTAIDRHLGPYSYRERAQLNSARDREVLVKGPIPRQGFDYQEEQTDGSRRQLSTEEIQQRARQVQGQQSAKL